MLQIPFKKIKFLDHIGEYILRYGFWQFHMKASDNGEVYRHGRPP